MLTLAQTLLIEIKTLTPPWRASQLPDPSRTVSLRSVVDAAGEQRIPIFERVRPLFIAKSQNLGRTYKSLVRRLSKRRTANGLFDMSAVPVRVHIRLDTLETEYPQDFRDCFTRSISGPYSSKSTARPRR